MDEATRERWLTGLAVLVGPLVFLLGFSINYALVPWACAADRPWVLHGVTLAMLLLALAGGAFVWREQRNAFPGESGTRPRFMTMLGMLVSGLFVLVILAQWLPQFVLNPCAQ